MLLNFEINYFVPKIDVMEDMIFYDRLQFGFTIIFHYIFPQFNHGIASIDCFF